MKRMQNSSQGISAELSAYVNSTKARMAATGIYVKDQALKWRAGTVSIGVVP